MKITSHIKVFAFFASIMLSGCATMILVQENFETNRTSTVYRTGKDVDKIKVYLKKNKLVVQYIGDDGNETGDSKLFKVEAEYDISRSVEFNESTYIIKPVSYNKKHYTYKKHDGWSRLPVSVELSDKINKYSYIYDRGSDLYPYDFKDYINNNPAENSAFSSLINSINARETLVAASVLPAMFEGELSSDKFERRAVFVDNRAEEKISYIMILPAHEIVTYNDGFKVKGNLILLPVTISFDIITSPIQIPLLKAVSEIGN